MSEEVEAIGEKLLTVTRSSKVVVLAELWEARAELVGRWHFVYSEDDTIECMGVPSLFTALRCKATNQA